MSIYNDITELITILPAIEGYPDTDQQVPYVVIRPLTMAPEGEPALDGSAFAWDDQYTVYCCGGSVEAAHNLALGVMLDLQGKRVGGTTLSTSMGYTGALVEGHYESQVTVQLTQGGIQ